MVFPFRYTRLVKSHYVITFLAFLFALHMGAGSLFGRDIVVERHAMKQVELRVVGPADNFTASQRTPFPAESALAKTPLEDYVAVGAGQLLLQQGNLSHAFRESGKLEHAHRWKKRDDAKEWCDFLQSSPEPRLVLYNRIPKAGSSTIRHLLEETSSRRSFHYKTLLSEFWGDASSGTNLRRRVVAQLKETVEQTKGRPVISDGHFFGDPVRWDEIGMKHANEVAYVNVMRTPVERLRSLWYYDKTRPMEIREQHWEHIDSWEQCLGDEKCLMSQENMCTTGQMQKFVCSGIPQERCTALKILSPTFFTVLGVTEAFAETLEMLECAFPTTFSAAAALYRHKNVKINTAGASRPSSNNSIPLEMLLAPSCTKEQSLYDDVHLLFWARHARMVANRNLCCRQKHLTP